MQSQMVEVAASGDMSAAFSALAEVLQGPTRSLTADIQAFRPLYTRDPEGACDMLLAAIDTHGGNPENIAILEGIWLNWFCVTPSNWLDQEARRFGCARFQTPRKRLIAGLSSFAEGETSHRILARGALHFLNNRCDLAYPLFEQAAQGMLQRMYLGAHSIAPPPSDLAPPAITIHHRHDRDFTVLVAADMVYYRTFIHELYQSLRPTGFGLHVHIINPTASHGGYINLPGVGYSSETLEGRDVSYLACNRFLIAGEIMDAYDTPVLISDMDAVLRAPGEKTRARLVNDVTVSIAPWGSGHVPWRIVPAAATLVKNSDRGRAFLTMLEARILAGFRPNQYPKSWWFDQQALFDTAISMGPLRPFMSAPFAPNTSKNQIKGKAKKGG